MLDDALSPNPTAFPGENTVFTLTVSEGACEDQAEIEILVHPNPSADYLISAMEGCAPLTVSFAQNSPDAVNYIWDFGDGSPISNEASPVHTYEMPGLYPVSFTSIGSGGCSNVNTEEAILVREAAFADFEASILLPDSVALPNSEVFFTNLSQYGTQYFWDFGDGGSSREEHPVYRFEEAGTYTVTLLVTDESGCVDSATMGPFVIYEPSLLIPNLFTPNDDGINDVFRVRYTGNEPMSMSIFDRWGRPVFEGQQMEWDGRNRQNEPSVEGVYFYVITIGGKAFQGNVTLLR